MDVVSLSQQVALALSPESLRSVLRSLQNTSFTIPGFHTLEKVPPVTLNSFMGRKVQKEKKLRAEIFLSSVAKCQNIAPSDEELVQSIAVWIMSPERAEEMENKIQKICKEKTAITDNNTAPRKDEADVLPQESVQNTRTPGRKDIAKEQKETIKSLRKMNQSLKTANETLLNDSLNKEKEIKRLKTALADMEKQKKESDEKANDISKRLQKSKEQKTYYEKVLARAPRILVFAAGKLSQEELLLYNLDIHGKFTDLERVDLSTYQSIWITEKDFPLGHIQVIRERARESLDIPVRTAYDLKSMIKKMR